MTLLLSRVSIQNLCQTANSEEERNNVVYLFVGCGRTVRQPKSAENTEEQGLDVSAPAPQQRWLVGLLEHGTPLQQPQVGVGGDAVHLGYL